MSIRTTPIPDDLVRLAEAQAGALSVEQLREFEISRKVQARLIERDGWRQPLRGTVLVHAGPVTFEAACWLGVLAGGAASVVAGKAAAHRLKFADEPHDITIAVPHGTSVANCDRWNFVQRRTIGRSRGELSTLNPEDVVLDLCEEQPARIEHWITAAVRARVTTVPRLRGALERRARHRARAALRLMLDDVGEGIESPLEGLYLRSVERAHALPRATRQVRRSRYRTDVEYLGGLVIVELDGELGHTGSDAWDDWDRDNVHAIGGSITLRFGWKQVRSSPCEVARRVLAALLAKGWNNLIAKCRNCQLMPLAG